MSTYSRVGVVTGANKGVGLATVRQLALQYPKSPLNSGPFLIYLTARDKGRGEAALKSLEQDTQLKQAKALKVDGGLSEIKFHQFDVTDTASVEQLAKDLKSAHGERGVDFIINNAGIALNGFDSNVVQQTLDCNYYKTLAACHTLLPLLRPSSGLIVNLASIAGSLKKLSPALRSRFLASKSEADVTQLMQDFQKAVDAGTQEKDGWVSAAYSTSKAGLIGGTRAFARSVKEGGGEGGGVRVVSCCPGYVNTDMSKGNGTKTPDQGASTSVWLALGMGEGKVETGTFWRDEREIKWEDL